MDPKAPVTTTTKRKRTYSDMAADLGGLWTFTLVLIGTFFVPSGLIDKEGQQIMILRFLFKAQKVALLKKQPLFVGDSEDAPSEDAPPAFEDSSTKKTVPESVRGETEEI